MAENWQIADPTAPPELESGDLVVWQFDLAKQPEISCLSPGELQRAARLRQDGDCRRFVATRTALRCLLGGYLGRKPAEIELVETAEGKPVLDGSGRGLHFNLSHSDDVMVVAVTGLGPVGIDVERGQRFAEMDGIIDQICGAEEAVRLRERMDAFPVCWTRKEAFIKALGLGMSFDPRRVEITIAPEDAPRITAIDGDIKAAAAWWLAPLAPHPGYVGAVCLKGVPHRLRRFRFYLS